MLYNMKTSLFRSMWGMLLLGLLFVAPSCVKEDFDTVPQNPPSTLVANTTIKQLRDYYSNSDVLVKVSSLFPSAFYADLKAKGLDTVLIVKATVVSSDSAGSFYKSLSIDDGTGGISVSVDVKNLYKAYKPGQSVVLKLSDLYVKRYVSSSGSKGDLQLGVFGEGKTLGSIGDAEIVKYVELSGSRDVENPLKVTLSELSKDMLGRLIRVDGVQFVEQGKPYYESGVNTRTLQDCDGNALDLLMNSSYVLFGKELLPVKNGSIVGVLGIFNGKFQLAIRSDKDVVFVNDRCTKTTPTANTTIAALRAMYSGSTFMKITTPTVIEATVVANDASGNLYKQVFLQDATGGMELKINRKAMSADYPVGQKVIINCEGLFLGSYGGVTQLGGTFEGSSGTAFGGIEVGVEALKVFKVSGGTIIAPTITTISALSDANLMKLIQLDDVQFADSELGLAYAPSTSPTNRTLRDCGGATVVVRTSNFANFAKTVVPDKKGTFVGVLGKFNGTYQLILREAADANFTQPRCQ